MKILFLNTHDDPACGGGAEVMLWEQMRGLVKAGHECVLLVTSSGNELARTEREGVRVWRAGICNLYWPDNKKTRAQLLRMLWHVIDSYNPLMQGRLRRILDIEKPDIVSIHNLSGWSSAAWNTIWDTGLPSVQVLHDPYAICPKAAMYKKGRNCTRQCVSCGMLRLPHRSLSYHVNAVVGVSRYILERHRRLGYFDKVPIQRVIHNVRDPVEMGLQVSQSASTYNDGFRLGFIGRLIPAKGVELLIEAFNALSIPNSELLIAGSGPEAYEGLLYKLASNKNIRFLGQTSAAEFYSSVDVVVVPSLWEDPFPTVVFEALAFGKPVIGSHGGGIPEMIHHGKNGLLFDPDQPLELSAAIEKLAGDKEYRSILGSAASKSALPFLDQGRWIGDYISLYETVMLENKLNAQA